MGVDSLKTRFHLTPDGWVQGAQKNMIGIKDSDDPRPDNCLLTIEELVEQRSRWSPEETTCTEIWRKEGLTDAELNELFKQFGKKCIPS